GQISADAGAEFCEAVIGGPTAMIIEGNCPIYYAGPSSHLSRVADICAPVGTCMRLGQLGQAAAFNLATLTYLYPLIHGFALACGMVEKSHLDMSQFLDFVEHGSLGHPGELLCRFLYPAHFETRNYALFGPAQIKNDGAKAESSLLLKQAQELGLSTPLLASVHAAHHAAFQRNPEADWSSIFDELVPIAPIQEEVTFSIDKTPPELLSQNFDVNLTVSDAMRSEIVSVSPDTTMRAAAEIFVKTQRGDLVVRDSENNFLGTVSEGDLIRAVLPDFDEMLRANVSSASVNKLFLNTAKSLLNEKITRLIIRDPIILQPKDTLIKAAACMAEKKIGRLPVVSERKIVGDLSRADLCWAMMKEWETT
ncbi:MAG: CBS domain-containing protein, partial [Gammaproteobacteria bacterium]